MKQFQYYEIRACVRDGNDRLFSFLGSPVFDLDGGTRIHTPENAESSARANHPDRNVFWVIFGVDQSGAGEPLVERPSFQAALDTLHAMLIPLRHAIDGTDPVSDIEDILNQSSNEVRL